MSSSRLTNRTSPRLLAWLVAFAIGLLLQPMVSAMGELHGSLIHDETSLSHAGSSHDDADHAPQDNGIAHALLHVAHCCGHVQALPVSVMVTPAHRHASPRPDIGQARVADQPAGVALRPPIRA